MLIKKDNKILTVTRKNNGRLCLPGGKVEPDDYTYSGSGSGLDFIRMMTRAAIRETQEETGLLVTNTNLMYVSIDEHGNYCELHKSLNYTGVEKPETDIYWVTLEHLLSYTEFPKYYIRAKQEGAFD
jgi:8-oxo-dGTP pyrophosphatase MutT (NUDIX family)